MIYISHHILKKWLVIAPSDDPRWNLNACGWRQWIASSRHPQRAPGVNVCRVSGPNHRSFFESFAILIILYIYILFIYLLLFILIYYYLLLFVIISYYVILYYIILYDFCAGQISTKCFFPIHRVLFVGPQGLFISVGWLKHWKIYRKKQGVL
jgi:hypothetical protein